MTICDVHCHLVPRDLAEIVAPLPSVHVTDDAMTTPSGRFPFPPVLSRPDLLEDRLAPGERVLVSPPPALYLDELTVSAASRYAAALNDGMMAFVDGHSCAGVLAWLPVGAPAAAVAEARRVARMGEAVGVVVGTSAFARAIAGAESAPLWAELASAGLSLLVHPDEDPLSSAPLPFLRRPQSLGFMVASTTTLLGALCTPSPLWEGGPAICFTHGGGLMAACLDRVVASMPAETARTLLDRIASVFVDGVVFGSSVFELVVETFGRDHVLPGSDWPFQLMVTDPERRARFGSPGEGPAPAPEATTSVRRWCPRAAVLGS